MLTSVPSGFDALARAILAGTASIALDRAGRSAPLIAAHRSALRQMVERCDLVLSTPTSDMTPPDVISLSRAALELAPEHPTRVVRDLRCACQRALEGVAIHEPCDDLLELLDRFAEANVPRR